MEIVHNLGILSIKKDIKENAGFLLSNKRGSYCSFFSLPSSRYQGLFWFDEKTMNMYKFIENIEMKSNDIVSLKNGFYSAQRKKNGVTESFLMPKNFNSLIYELSDESEIDVILDCKESFDNREWGRNYNVLEKDGCIVMEFTKKTDKREDENDGIEEFSLYLAIKSSSNIHKKNDMWIERHYDFDRRRNSVPFARYVYNALRLKGSKFVFSMSKSLKDAVRECHNVFKSLDEIKNRERLDFFGMLKNEQVKKIIKNEKIGKEAKVAYLNAFNSLNKLIVDGRNCGLFAGFPWFSQFWSRDTAVSLKALSTIDGEFSKKLMLGYLAKIGNDGRLPNLSGKHKSEALGSADAHGWLFLRCSELVGKISKNKDIINSIKSSVRAIKSMNAESENIKAYIKKCSSIVDKKEKEFHSIIFEIESSLEKSILNLLKFRTKGTFEVNGSLETWMDTSVDENSREGARIEIQALRLGMYRLMFEVTQNEKYRILENLLRSNLKNKFWNGKILADGLQDFTIRPNVFIAAYAYPGLLEAEEWEKCFQNSLNALWLEWGGISTIDKSNTLFTGENTGEDIKSYHHGDSWFWINNLAAIALNRINKNKFDRQIKKILSASAEEILWKGCIGCHSELSSASHLESNGCFNQAWSNSMFIELIDELTN